MQRFNRVHSSATGQKDAPLVKVVTPAAAAAIAFPSSMAMSRRREPVVLTKAVGAAVACVFATKAV